MSTKKNVKKSYSFDNSTTVLLIGMYKQRPELLKVDLNKYKNKEIRKMLTEIADELNESLGNPGITCEDVCRRIKWLHKQYFKELEKVAMSKSSGAAIENVYKPNLWCFNQLHFLNKSSNVKKEEYEKSKERATTSTDHDGAVDELKHTTSTSSSTKRRAPKERTVAVKAPKAKEPKISVDFDEFGRSVTTELKKIKDQQMVINLKKNILDLIFDTQKDAIELGKFETNE